jgi:cytochrome c5
MKLFSVRTTAWLFMTMMLAAAAFAFGQEVALPEGDGKTIVEAKCTVCHDTSLITMNHLDKDAWKAMIDVMVASGAEVSADEMPVLLEYLVKNFGPQ